jgi:hypothetical protein
MRHEPVATPHTLSRRHWLIASAGLTAGMGIPVLAQV